MTAIKIIAFILVEALLVLAYMHTKTKKTSVFKNIAFILIQIVILTWFLPAGYYSGGEFADLGMYRIGFFDFFQLIFGSFQFGYFIQIVLLLVSVGALYGVLGKTGKYRAWIEKIAYKFKRKELLFLIIIATLIALLTSAFDYGLTLFIFIPAIISIILTMGYDKITAILTTFGAMLIGTIGATLNENIVGSINAQISGTSLTTGLYYKLALLVLSLAVLIFFLSKAKIKKVKIEDKKDNKKDAKVKEEKVIKEENTEDLFIGEKASNKYPVWPIYTIFIILFILLVLALTPWESVLGVSAFANFHTWLTEITVSDITLVQYILGTISALGEWYYAEMAVICILASLLIGTIYGNKLTDTFAYMAEGAKKMLAPALMVVFAYTVIYFTGNTMFFGTIADFILSLTDNFNIFLSAITMFLGSIFNVDMLYVTSYITPQLVGMFAGNETVIALLTQSIYGVTMFIAPTSALLVLGLTYLNVPYKEWVKKTWKLTLVLLAITLIILIIATLI